MNKKEKQQIKYLLENLKWYAEAPNEQDYNGEYEPPMEWEQGEAKIFLKYLEEKDKEMERLNNIINELEEYICVIEYDERHSDSWQIPVRIHNKLKELKGSDKEWKY